ncbi:MAG: MFS transporter [Thermoguttaceae bacterium]|nr:MFS transporter [Thermoguttaceae bacterium]
MSIENNNKPRGLFSLSFLGLLFTQFTVAMNDNIFRWLLVPIGKARLGVYYGGDYDFGANIALTVGGLMFLIPFILFSGYGGFCADRFCKRRVMILCKAAEVLIMLLGILFIWIGNPWLLFVVLFLMGTQSAFYSPAKYACIPEIVGDKSIPTANGLIGMSTIVAVLAGTLIGNNLYDWTTLPDADGLRNLATAPGQHNLWLSASVLVGVAVFGLLTSLCIQKMPALGTKAKLEGFQKLPMGQSLSDFAYLWRHKALLLVALGSAYYWGLASLAQTNIDRFVVPEITEAQGNVALFLGILAIGIAIGSVLVGFFMRGKTTLKPIVFSAFGMAACAIALYFTPEGTGKMPSAASQHALIALVFLGTFAGMFDIPLMAYLQKNGEESQRGRIIGGSNFLSFTAMTLGVAVFGVLISALGTRGVWLFAGIITILVGLICVFFVFLQKSVAVLFHLFYRLFYRIRVEGAENLPKNGPFVLASNHVSYLDGMLMYYMLPFREKPHILVWAAFTRPALLHKLAELNGVIPIEPGKMAVKAIREATKVLDEGHPIGIFPEGGITRHGTLMPFKPGIAHMLRGRDHIPVVPMYIGGLWGSIFSHKDRKFLWKWPQRFTWRKLLTLHFRRDVTVYIGKPISDFCHQDVRALPDAVQALQHRWYTEHWMTNGSRTDQFGRDLIPVRQMLRLWKKELPNRVAFADLSMEITRRKALIGSLIFRRRLHKLLGKDEQNVGVLIPPCVPSALTNAALTLDRRAAVNLNYTVSNEILNHCIHKVDMKHVVTSKKVMADKNFAKFKPECDLIYLEDIKASVTLWDKICAITQALVLPLWLVDRQLGLHKIKPSDTLTIIFTSGSTGIPKGVVLSHQNIAGNIYAFMDILQVNSLRDSALGILPFFHSFGYTCILWGTLSKGYQSWFHTSPLDFNIVTRICRKYPPTILVGTPTFLRMYSRKLKREDLENVKIVVSGAERCPSALMDEYEAKFGVRPVQGYGVTEASPVVGVNIPVDRQVEDWIPKQKDASIGLPLFGTSVQVRNLETGKPCKANEVGMLWISGINVMQGYYGEPEKTAEVLKDGWYCTGDLVYQDQENFIFIAGRLSRFAKLGGEMVPQEGIEDALNKILGNPPDAEPRVAVTSIPDEKKGERIIVLHTGLNMKPSEINTKFLELGYPALWIPNVDAYYQVESIPLLGTGKPDLYAIHETALKLTSAEA